MPRKKQPTVSERLTAIETLLESSVAIIDRLVRLEGIIETRGTQERDEEWHEIQELITVDQLRRCLGFRSYVDACYVVQALQNLEDAIVLRKRTGT